MEYLSLGALVGVIALSCFTKVNPGLLALGLAWVLGVYAAGMPVSTVAAGFPAHMFIVLMGITYLFGMAQQNGSLKTLAESAIRTFRHTPWLVPVFFFVLAAGLSMLGASNIGAVALLAPIAMAAAWEIGISAVWMTIILICGANAGTFSPFALTGAIANNLIAQLGLSMNPWKDIFIPSLAAQSLLAGACYFFCIWKIKKRHAHAPQGADPSPPPLTAYQKSTLLAIVLLITGATVFKADIGFLSLTLGCCVALLHPEESKSALKHVPWDIIFMVCGINTLISVLEHMGGLELLTHLLAKIATPDNATFVTAFITSIISAFSSSSGVVLPTFIPLVPGLIEKIGGGNPFAIISSINVGSHVADISPLSTLGAICIASTVHENKEKLFRILLGFGLLMAPAGALLCLLLFGRL